MRESSSTTNPVKGRIGYKTKIFSLQTKEAFLSYLKEVETLVPRDHLEMVHEVYGKFWPIPFSKLKPSNLAT